MDESAGGSLVDAVATRDQFQHRAENSNTQSTAGALKPFKKQNNLPNYD